MITLSAAIAKIVHDMRLVASQNDELKENNGYIRIIFIPLCKDAAEWCNAPYAMTNDIPTVQYIYPLHEGQSALKKPEKNQRTWTINRRDVTIEEVSRFDGMKTTKAAPDAAWMKITIEVCGGQENNNNMVISVAAGAIQSICTRHDLYLA